MQRILYSIFLMFFVRNIFTQSNTCADGQDPYCAVCNNGECDVCYKSYLDTANGFCIYPDNPVQGCLFYQDNSTQCQRCEMDHILDNNECIQVDQPINNCVIYQDLNNCEVCRDNLPDAQGNCEGNPCSDIDENCRECYEENGDQICHACDNGFHVSNDNRSCIDDGNVDFILHEDKECIENNDGECKMCGLGYFVSEYESQEQKCEKSSSYKPENENNSAIWSVMSISAIIAVIYI